jgi:bifunctional DNA primase/polymerase-like protein
VLGQRALALARRGLWVFPCVAGAKEPATPKGCLDAATDPALIDHWWRQDPKFNIAIATGMRSHIFVLDIDGADAEAELRKLEGQNGELPPTVEAITARGWHLYFEYPAQPVRNSAGRIAAGIDVRGEGGYVLAPPSLHPSGRRYCWSVDSTNTFAAAPPWLLAKATESDGNGTATPPVVWRDLVRDGVEDGKRNTAVTRLAGHLLRRRVECAAVRRSVPRKWPPSSTALPDANSNDAECYDH